MPSVTPPENASAPLEKSNAIPFNATLICPVLVATNESAPF